MKRIREYPAVNHTFVCRAAATLRTLTALGCILCLAAGASPARAADSPGGEGTASLSLKQCIELMLANNLDLMVERFNPDLQEKEIVKENALFDPLARLSFQDSKLLTSPTTLLNGVLRDTRYEQETIDYDAGLAKRFLTGGIGEVRFTTDRFETNSFWQYESPTYFSQVVFSLNQPLLRNFGIDFNRSRIRISTNNREISKTQLADRTAKMVSGLQQLYWNLYLSRQVLAVKKGSLQLARDLMKRNEALVEVGKLPAIEILRAKTGVASREEAVIVADNAVRDLEDLLKERLNSPLHDRSVVLMDKPIPRAFQKREVSDYLGIALAKRPECEQARMQLENLKIAYAAAKNAMLPLLDVQASYGINATKPHYSRSVHGLDAGGDYSWLLGFKMEIPLGNRWAKNNYEKSALELKKAETALASLQNKIELEIQETIRQIETNQQRINATREARRLSETSLAAEEERMTLGMSTSVDVLRVQEELAAAQAGETMALVDYINSLDGLDEALGTLLESCQISVGEAS
jgi:outer membrane protein TolC